MLLHTPDHEDPDLNRTSCCSDQESGTFEPGVDIRVATAVLCQACHLHQRVRRTHGEVLSNVQPIIKMLLSASLHSRRLKWESPRSNWQVPLPRSIARLSTMKTCILHKYPRLQ
eukprot:3630670-Amphidinium_carterae.1